MFTRGYQHSALITILWLSFWSGILGASSGKALAQEESPVLTSEISETSNSEILNSETPTPDTPKPENIDSSQNSENAEPASESDRTDESEASSLPNADPPLASATSSPNALALRHASLEIINTLLPPSPSHFPSLEHTPLGDRIRAFTVTVWGETSWGTGVIIQQQPTPGGWDYWVVTNSHVIRDDSVNIQTFDRQAYSTLIVLDDRIGGYDLAILRFSSSRPYNVASVQTEVQLDETTIAVGFPFDRADLITPENSEFHWTEGKIVHILDESLVDGYQFAYSNAIEKGMSGGPVLNLRGELIAINGLHAYPLWGNPFVYPDGRSIEPELSPPPEESSWSIPIATVLERGTEFWVDQVTSRPGNSVILRSHETAEIGMNP
jgi:S1-C subfamily serine protease